MSDATTETGQELIVDFVDEAVESLRDLPARLDEHRLDPADADPINAVFRSVHSIKGCAGFLGLTAVKVFSHTLENTMDEVRKGKLTLSEELQRVLVEGIDLLEAMLQRALDGQIESDLGAEEQDLLARVEQSAGRCRIERGPEDELIEQILQLAEEIAQESLPQAAEWASRVQELVEVYHKGDAESPEESDQPPTPAAAQPKPQDLKDLACQCAGQDVSGHLAAVCGVFLAAQDHPGDESFAAGFFKAADDFVAWADGAGEESLAAALRSAKNDLQTILNSPLDLDATMMSVIWDQLWPEFVKFEGVRSWGESESEEDLSAAQSAAAGTEQTAASSKTPAQPKARLVRVKEERIDGFLEDVSRLFIIYELLKDLHTRMAGSGELAPLDEELRQVNAAFNVQSSSLQRNVVALRRVAISGLFSKVPRMVRTLASQLGRTVDVVVEGQETEVDKSLVEDLDAPLNHMVRNAIDHAFESPEDRVARGVPEAGTLTLKAELTRTHVMITIQDDGRGIDPKKLRDKAVEKGIYSREEVDDLSEQETLKLIFHAGFSTAEQLSDVSGRGVGMDVVRTNLREHNGEIFVESQIGIGSIFRLEIPIREAVVVIDGLMLREAGDSFVLPFEHILEITEIHPQDLKPVQGSRVATIRGNTYEAVRLGKVLELDWNDPLPGRNYQAILVGCKLGKICLLVDEICGHKQIVLNSLNDILPGTDNIAGVAQLGGGRLALVLSVEDLVRSLCHGTTSQAD